MQTPSQQFSRMAGPTFAPKNERERVTFTRSVLAGETALGPTGFTRWCASEYAILRSTLSPLLDYFGPGTTPAPNASVVIEPNA